MVVPQRQRVDGPALRKRNGHQVVAHLASRRPSREGVPLAQLSVLVVAPALYVGIVQKGARVVTSGGHLDGGASRAKIDSILVFTNKGKGGG